MTVPIEQLQRDLARLLEKVQAGEEIVITRDGQPIATIVANAKPSESPPGDRVPGSAKGQIWMSPDFDEPLDEFREYMG
jgi:prevent-host-death family protein